MVPFNDAFPISNPVSPSVFEYDRAKSAQAVQLERGVQWLRLSGL